MAQLAVDRLPKRRLSLAKTTHSDALRSALPTKLAESRGSLPSATLGGAGSAIRSRSEKVET